MILEGPQCWGMGHACHPAAGSAFARVPHWCALEAPICWWPGAHLRSVPPSSRHGRVALKVKGFISTWRRLSSWSPALGLVSSVNQACGPVQFATVQTATTPSNVCSASCGSTRNEAASVIDRWMTNITSAPGVAARLSWLTADQLLRWLLMTPCLMWGPLSTNWVTCCAPVGLWQCNCPQMLHGLGKIQDTFSCPNYQAPLA